MSASTNATAPPVAITATAVTPNAAPPGRGVQHSADDPTAGLSVDTLHNLGVLPWLDPEIDDHAEDPRSAYVETFWLPILGPSTTLLLRRLADEFDASPDGFEIDCSTVSREIGLGPRLHHRSPFLRTVDRIVKFNLAQIVDSILYVRRQIPRLRPRQVARLSERLQTLHASWTLPDDGAQRRTELVRATHLARTLLALDGTAHEIERQLHQWHFHPSIAWHAVQWAQSDPSGETYE